MVTQTTDRSAANLAEALSGLSPEGMELITSLIRQMGGNGNGATQRIGKPADGIPHWVDKMKSERYADTTIRLYRYLITRHLKVDPIPTRLGIQAYMSRKLESGVSPAYVECERKALKSLFSFLKEEGLWLLDPTEGIRRVKVSYGNRTSPPSEDVKKVLESGHYRARDADKLRTLVTLLATTGLRLTEACSLRIDSVDFAALELRIRGKGDKHRIVPLLPSTAEALKGYIDRHPSKSPFVFPGETGKGYAHVSNVEKTLRRACIRAGVKPFPPHALRHFYATEMLKKGAKLEVVGRILGHASIGTTADIYRHVRTAEMHEEQMRFAPMNHNLKH